MPPDPVKGEALSDRWEPGASEAIREDDPIANGQRWREERDRLRVEVEALKANACPDGEVCKSCPCAGEDDMCFPGERLRAELAKLEEDYAGIEEALDTEMAENERLRAGIIAVYRESSAAAIAVAKACDSIIDRSGRFLGEVRILSRAS